MVREKGEEPREVSLSKSFQKSRSASNKRLVVPP